MVFRILVALAFAIVCAPPAWAATFALGNPASGAIKSGVGLISGWVCDADELEVSFDGGPRQFVPYGSERPDTAGVCGDTDNGFGLLWNYNELGDGPHTVTLYIDGMVATQVDFNVVTLGTNFLRGVTGHGTITLSDGKQIDVQWEETTQGVTITGYTDGSGTTVPSSDTEVTLNRLRGQWRVYYGDPQNDNFDVWDFSDGKFRQENGVYVLRGDFASLDRIEWVDLFLASEVYVHGPEWVTETSHTYVALQHDIHDDDYGNTCGWDFFSLTSPDSFSGRGISSKLYDDGTCGPIPNASGLDITGVRIQP